MGALQSSQREFLCHGCTDYFSFKTLTIKVSLPVPNDCQGSKPSAKQGDSNRVNSFISNPFFKHHKVCVCASASCFWFTDWQNKQSWVQHQEHVLNPARTGSISEWASWDILDWFFSKILMPLTKGGIGWESWELFHNLLWSCFPAGCDGHSGSAAQVRHSGPALTVKPWWSQASTFCFTLNLCKAKPPTYYRDMHRAKFRSHQQPSPLFLHW